MYFEHNTPRLINTQRTYTRSVTCRQGSANFPAGLAPISAAQVKNSVLRRGGGHPRLTYPFHDDPACALSLSLSHTQYCVFVCLLSKADAVCGSPLDHSPLLCSFISAGDIKTSYVLSGCTLWVLHAHLSLECSDLSPQYYTEKLYFHQTV